MEHAMKGWGGGPHTVFYESPCGRYTGLEIADGQIYFPNSAAHKRINF